MKTISEHITEYLVKYAGEYEKIKSFSEFVENFFEEDKEIKYAFKEDIEDFILNVNKEELEAIIKTFKHKDDTVVGVKWSCEDTEAVAKQYDVPSKVESYGKEYKPIYFWFLMNYVYAVHYNPTRNVQGYIELAIDEYCNKVVCFKDMIKHLVEYYEK